MPFNCPEDGFEHRRASSLEEAAINLSDSFVEKLSVELFSPNFNSGNGTSGSNIRTNQSRNLAPQIQKVISLKGFRGEMMKNLLYFGSPNFSSHTYHDEAQHSEPLIASQNKISALSTLKKGSEDAKQSKLSHKNAMNRYGFLNAEVQSNVSVGEINSSDHLKPKERSPALEAPLSEDCMSDSFHVSSITHEIPFESGRSHSIPFSPIWGASLSGCTIPRSTPHTSQLNHDQARLRVLEDDFVCRVTGVDHLREGTSSLPLMIPFDCPAVLQSYSPCNGVHWDTASLKEYMMPSKYEQGIGMDGLNRSYHRSFSQAPLMKLGQKDSTAFQLLSANEIPRQSSMGLLEVETDAPFLGEDGNYYFHVA